MEELQLLLPDGRFIGPDGRFIGRATDTLHVQHPKFVDAVILDRLARRRTPVFRSKCCAGQARHQRGPVLATSLIMSRAAGHDWRAYLVTAAATVIFVRTDTNPLIVVAAAALLGYVGFV